MPLKIPLLPLAILAGCWLTAPAKGGEEIRCKSPDGKFALRHFYDDREPSAGSFSIVETSTRNVAAQLGPDGPRAAQVNLVWSSDSQRVAYFKEQARTGTTRVFFRRGFLFTEIKLPELPDPKPPAVTSSDGPAEETIRRVEPIGWLKSGDLLLENELQNASWGRAALEITIGFDQEQRASIRKAEPQEISIIDYLLQLPRPTFEGSALETLSFMRRPGTIIDKKNGYIRCKGDGGQADFEVALFRYRDRRPLIAVCSSDMEGEKSTYLEFFETGPDGKMQKIADSIFPLADARRDEARKKLPNSKFELPHYGETILVRNRRSGKVLHKISWNGENFQGEK